MIRVDLNNYDNFQQRGGPHSTMDSVLASHPAAQGLITVVPKNFSEFLMLLRLIDGVAV